MVMHFSFLDFFFWPAIALKHGLLLVMSNCSSSLCISVIDLFLQELWPFNLEKCKNFSVFQTFYSHHVAAIGLRLGLLFCSKELRIVFQCY
jgi:hypothetical protein